MGANNWRRAYTLASQAILLKSMQKKYLVSGQTCCWCISAWRKVQKSGPALHWQSGSLFSQQPGRSLHCQFSSWAFVLFSHHIQLWKEIDHKYIRATTYWLKFFKKKLEWKVWECWANNKQKLDFSSLIISHACIILAYLHVSKKWIMNCK